MCLTACQSYRPGPTFLARMFSEKTRVLAIASASSLSSTCKNLHFVIFLLLLNIFTLKWGYVFTIQRAIHTIIGENSKRIFFRITPLFLLRLFILYQAPHSRAFAPACGALAVQRCKMYVQNFIAVVCIGSEI